MKSEKEVPEEYLKGWTIFLGCKIDLSKRVFIPRPETEFWVKKALEELKTESCSLAASGTKVKKMTESSSPIKNYKLKINVLDMFAGSGCVGIAVLKNIKNSKVDFVDIDKKAIEQIKINLKLNKVSAKKYKIYQSDIFEKLREKTYNIIFANPPYVARERIREIQSSVLKYEPKIALFGGRKGLDIIKKFLEKARKHLKDKGIIYLEFDPLQKKDIESILIEQRYGEFKFNKDQLGKWRWLVIHNTRA